MELTMILQEKWDTILITISGLAAWINERNKRLKELELLEQQVKSADIEALREIINTQRESIRSLRDEAAQLRADYMELRKRFDEKIAEIRGEYEGMIVAYEKKIVHIEAELAKTAVALPAVEIATRQKRTRK